MRIETIPYAWQAKQGAQESGARADSSAAQLATGPVTRAPIRERDLGRLPASAVRYFRFMRVVGKPRDGSLAVRMRGSFRLSARSHWMPMAAWQYDNGLEVARVFHMRARFLHLLPIVARDTYVRGKGHMQARLFDRRTVAEASGYQLDLGELVTYLNDAVLMAPSMLLNDRVTFREINGRAFEVTLRDHGHRVTARVYTDGRGVPVNFVTDDRFVANPDDPERRMIRARWSTPVAGYRCVDDRMLPTAATACWQTPGSEFAYARVIFEPKWFAFNRDPMDLRWWLKPDPTRQTSERP
jgi:hypothetical protein